MSLLLFGSVAEAVPGTTLDFDVKSVGMMEEAVHAVAGSWIGLIKDR